MKKIFTLLFFSVFCFLTSDLIFAQDENHDAVYLKLKKEYTLNADGSIDYQSIKKLKLQSYRAFNILYGETFVVYNPDFQNLKINEAYTIMADGKKNPSPSNAFNEVLPGFAANAPAYNKLREMVITHSGTERNAVLNLDYVLHSNKGFYPCLMGNELLCEAEPVKEMTFVIRIPSEAKLRYSVRNSKGIPAITKEGNFQVYTWTFANVPAISAEEMQVGGNDLYPGISFSTAPDRASVYRDFVKQSAFSYEVNGEMKQMTASLSSQYKDKSDLVLKFQDKVVNEFRLYPVPLKNTGFICRTAQQTWNSNGGTLAEKAILLTALLREAGLPETNPVFIIHGDLYDESIGSLMDVEDIAVKTSIPDMGAVLLSVSVLNPQDLSYALPGRILVELSTPSVSFGKTTQVSGKVKVDGSFSINEKKQLTGSINCSEAGSIAPYLSLMRDKDKAKSLFGGGISSSDLKDPVTVNAGKDESSISYTVSKDKPLRNDSDYYFLQLPVVSNGIDGLGIHLLTKVRTTPLELSTVIDESDEFAYLLPEKLNPFLPKEKLEIKNSSGEFVFEIKMEGRKLIIHKSLKLNKRIIETSDYTGFKSLMDHWNAERYREVVLVK
jgi:hypothetical protein